MEVHLVVEFSPTYEGGLSQFYRDFSRSVKYPARKNAADYPSAYYVSFVIDTVGRIQNFCMTISMKELVSPELLNKIDKWSPGSHEGKKVPVRMLLPLRIHLK